MSDELPEGWAHARIGDVFDSWGGMTPSTSEPKFWGGSMPWISSKDVKGPVVAGGTECVTNHALAENRLRTCPAGTVLVVVRSGVLVHTLPVAVTNREVVVNQDVKALDSGDRQLNAWAALYLRATQRQILEANRKEGTTVQSIRVPELLDHELAVAPLAEQRRIVAKVEALLEQVRRAKDRLDRVPLILKRFRRAVLAAACSGSLTSGWREATAHSEDAEQLVRSIFARRSQTQSSRRSGAHDTPQIQSLDSPVGWCETQIVNLVDCLDYARKPINRDERAGRIGSIPYYGANGPVGWIDTHLFDEELVLVVEDETFVGREKPFSYVIRGKAWVNNHAHVLRALGGMSADYLNICLSYYDFVPLTSGTTGRRKLTKSALMQAPLAIAPLAEQAEIVRRVDGLFSLATAIEQRVERAATRASSLPRAILSKAFAGELVPTEAELARAEGRDYETAEQLLERERAQSAEPTTTGKRPRSVPHEAGPVAHRTHRRSRSTRWHCG